MNLEDFPKSIVTSENLIFDNIKFVYGNHVVYSVNEDASRYNEADGRLIEYYRLREISIRNEDELVKFIYNPIYPYVCNSDPYHDYVGVEVHEAEERTKRFLDEVFDDEDDTKVADHE